MKKTFLFFAFFLPLLLTGCLKDDSDQSTIVLMGTEANVKPIEEVIPDTLLTYIVDTVAMHNQVIELPIGINPPDIQGEYWFAPRELYAYNDHHAVALDSVFIRFGGQPSFLVDTITLVDSQGNTLVDSLGNQIDSVIYTVYYSEGQHNMLVPCDIYGDVLEKGGKYNIKTADAYVVGSGSNFTVYFRVDYQCQESSSGQDYNLTRGYILTGEIADEGIKSAKLAIVNINVSSDQSSQYIALPEKDWIFVYRVKTDDPQNQFGVAVRKNWYDSIQ